MTTGSKVFGPTKDFPELTQPSGKPMLPRSSGYFGGGGIGDGLRFIDLLDTFDSYVGKAGLFIKVRMAEDGLEASLASAVGAFTDLSDTFASYTGLEGYVLAVNGTADGVEAIGIPFIQGDDIDMNYYQIQNLVLETVVGSPVTYVEGQIWYDQTTHTIQYFDGTNIIGVSAPDDDFHTLSFSSFSPTYELLIWNTDTNSYGKILFSDIISGTIGAGGFILVTGNSGSSADSSLISTLTLIADDTTLEFVTESVTSSAELIWKDQSANMVLAGPVSGGDDIPTFRGLETDDMPSSYHNIIWDTLIDTPLDTLVPYVGATTTVDLGSQELITTSRITAGHVTLIDAMVDGTDAASKAYVDMYLTMSIFWVDPCIDIVTALPGGTPTIGSRYILDGDKKIYTADGSGGWDTPSATVTGTTCFVETDNALIANEIGIYTYNGVDWVFMSFQVIHNDTIGLQGGVYGEYYHLTEDQHTIVTQEADGTHDGYLTQEDWIMFNEKADASHSHEDLILDWVSSGTGGYQPYAAKGAGKFDSGSVDPTNTTRLNYDGYFYSTRLYEGATRVSLVGHAHAESEITFTDITTNNASITKHGYLPKLPNDATKFLNGVGAWAVPSGGGGDSYWERNVGNGTINPLTHTDKVAIGSDDPGAYMLHVTGNGYYTGSVTVNSDIRTKILNGMVENVLGNLKYINPIKFSYKADKTPIEHFGFSAQEVHEIYPSIAIYDEYSDTYGIDAIGLAAIAIQGLKELNTKLEEEIADLQLYCRMLKKSFLNGKTTNN